MATESLQPQQTPDTDTPMMDPNTEPADTDAQNAADVDESLQKGRKRPRIEMGIESSQQRKRGKSMFGLVVGTLTRAKNEDKERNSSEAAKKRQLIEQRLQEKLKAETDSVRRAEEAKKDKTAANRKEEELQLRDSIYKMRRTRLPLLANFLLTSDIIPELDSLSSPLDEIQSTTMDSDPSSEGISKPARATGTTALSGPPRAHPPPLYYRPAVLTSAQEAFLKKRKDEVRIAVESEWADFAAERSAGIADITRLRQRVAEEEGRTKSANAKALDDGDVDDERSQNQAEQKETDQNVKSGPGGPPEAEVSQSAQNGSRNTSGGEDIKMDVDDSGAGTIGPEKTHGDKEENAPVPMHADDDDAVEY
ncbi:uncharacterized protein FIBRA_08285 [Fibroporia radiculosa]|uniref:Pinin/SDK/MemA protein domain-containing protein n=1 Tax=Fibroporia radiculosa TaxID=599839 RepID=J4H533_9APHY|nr:uncharacterized protein FIBRA_08285 [Fibroporia radiculosa]CCM06039.1 predicted protein [Fibroporia radiculosa]